MIATLLSVLLICTGLVFFIAGTLGLIRFPDVHARLHALTKADNLGLGFIVAGAALQTSGITTVVKLLLVWLLTLLASATASQLIARSAASENVPQTDGQ